MVNVTLVICYAKLIYLINTLSFKLFNGYGERYSRLLSSSIRNLIVYLR